MKKLFIISCGVVAMAFFSSLLFTSCKKKINPAHPSPENNRLLSYTKFITPVTGTPVNQTFRFYYDESGRVSQIAYTSNDATELTNNTAQRLMNFVYVNDSVFKTTRTVAGNIVLEIDTFILNSQKQLKHVYFPDFEGHFDYLNKLIYKDSRTVIDSGGSVTAGTTYTSNNGDLLNRAYDGTLTVHFEDSGISNYLFEKDTALTPPFTVTWDDYNVFPPVVQTTTHSNVTTYTDVLNGYTSGNMVKISALDTDGVVSYRVIWPGGIWQREGYFVYPDLENRVGDYMQIESFTTYGVNLYQNAHLIRRMVPQNGPVTDVLYEIDADSKIKQTHVTTTDKGLKTNTVVYKFQYETR